jgi:solute carrier family 13 (sodium-dependent dicarboxylate transporter), member 2/3/5
MEGIDDHKPTTARKILFWIAPVLSLCIMLFADLKPGQPQITYMLAIVVLVAMWWITEIIPLGITSLLPVILFPLFGIMDGKDVSGAYFNDIIFLFMGGFMVAIAIQKWNLHKRIALGILKLVGVSPARILFGFMLATAFISMWISNTATTMMMIPILISILSKLEEINSREKISHYSVGILLAVAYSATIGGIATLVGTPPNLSFVRIFEMYFPDAPDITFGNWFVFAFPVTVVLFILFFAYLYWFFVRNKTDWQPISKSQIENDYKALGRPSTEETIITILFIVMAALWFFRSNIEIGSFLIRGWATRLNYGEYLTDGTIAIFISFLLFLIPAPSQKGKRLMSWRDTDQLPWEIILLFGGGFALASGMKESGLSTWCGEQMLFLENVHPLLIICLIVLFITFLGEIASNTAMVETFLPVIAGLAVTLEINPLLFMIPAALGASMGFMLPIATPPNAIAFATRRITMGQMMRAGFTLNVIAVIIIALFAYYFAPFVFGISLDEFPLWALPK